MLERRSERSARRMVRALQTGSATYKDSCVWECQGAECELVREKATSYGRTGIGVPEMIVLKQSETFLWGGGGQASLLSRWPGVYRSACVLFSGAPRDNHLGSLPPGTLLCPPRDHRTTLPLGSPGEGPTLLSAGGGDCQLSRPLFCTWALFKLLWDPGRPRAPYPLLLAIDLQGRHFPVVPDITCPSSVLAPVLCSGPPSSTSVLIFSRLLDPSPVPGSHPLHRPSGSLLPLSSIPWPLSYPVL